MAATAAQLTQRLGYFDGFMRAWGAADAARRSEAYAETLDYRAGRIDGQTEVNEVSATLGIVAPPNVRW